MTTVTHAYTHGRPLLPVMVGVNRAKVFGLANAGRSVPQPVGCTLLIDTGAEDTWVTRATMGLLNLLPFNAVPVQTGALGSGAMQFDQYEISLRIPATVRGQTDVQMVSLPVLCGDFGGQSIDGLIGRDVLARCLATFDGRTQRFTLVFRSGGG